MPYKTELTEDCMGVVHTGSGVVTGAELLRGSRAVAQLVQNTENFHYEFVDLSEATWVEISSIELEQIAALDRMVACFRPNAVVVIVSPDEGLFALAKEWENLILDLGWKTHISRVRSEARSWLRENFGPEASQIAPREEHPQR